MNNGLDKLLNPSSIAVIGASDTEGRAGYIAVKNLLRAGFKGPILPVTPKYDAVCGVLSYPTIAALPRIPDMAILCTKGARNAELIEELGRQGVKLAIVLASGMYTGEPSALSLMLSNAKKYGMRLIGPNSMGLILPWLNLNASFAPIPAQKGNIAFISQSAAVCSTILDWAANKNIGFSTFISLGDSCDVDFSELLDIVSRDSKTSAILLYIDAINDPRRFMSAARAAARNRRILVLKSGRCDISAQLSQLHSGGKIGKDPAYEAAIRRSGMLRVHTTHELFAAVETLTHAVPLQGERLAIVTNGGGPAILAIDALMEKGGKLAQLSETTLSKLKGALPSVCHNQNPVDLMGDADAQRYCTAIKILLDTDDFDALLIMHSPSAISTATQTAEAVIDVIKQHPRARRFNILTNWSGEKSAGSGRHCLFTAGIPTYRTPESAISGFMHLVDYRRNQKQLMETPISVNDDRKSAVQARCLIEQAIAEGALSLQTHEVRPILEAYGFKTLRTWLASDPTEAVYVAEQIGYPVAVKLRSPDIEHKSEVQGVVLQLRDATEVASAAQAILDRVSLSYPEAKIDGLIVQSMANTTSAQELRIGVYRDAVFGPVIVLGEGGAEWNLNNDAAVAIPPLNMALARYLIINALKKGKIRQRSYPHSLNIEALCRTLVRLSQMVIDCPQIIELDINPLLATHNDMTVIDAQLHLTSESSEYSHQHLAICPYPKEWELTVTLHNGTNLLLRPILPEDEPTHQTFIQQVNKDDLYKRFFSDVGELDHEALAALTQIDYDREMAFVAVHNNNEIWGVARALGDAKGEEAEFAILVRSDKKGLGLGRILMEQIIRYSEARQLSRLTAMTMPSNRGMITLAQKLGFSVDVQFEDGIVEMELLLPLHNRKN
ncbi:GNAT family N-acetyltransferase [Thaumasiovibrio sp. DFM-14]|uniref:bifunctional acetate--CoA ligase family protein/GNAT family N-acetyltransferase n=1 Tax=Thaumasiovibrio sp. DFM-14 TaxID=3384792 RepID=UPI0039A049D9